MPSFDLLDKVELFVRAGTFPVDASKSSKKVTRAASKHFIYKGILELHWQQKVAEGLFREMGTVFLKRDTAAAEAEVSETYLRIWTKNTKTVCMEQ